MAAQATHISLVLSIAHVLLSFSNFPISITHSFVTVLEVGEGLALALLVLTSVDPWGLRMSAMGKALQTAANMGRPKDYRAQTATVEAANHVTPKLAKNLP